MSDPTNPADSWESDANEAIEGAKNVANNAVNSSKEVANNAVDSAKDVANNAIDAGEEVGNNAVDSARNVANNAIDSAEEVANNAINSAKDVANNAINSAKEAANNAIDAGEATANNAIDSAEAVATNALDSAKAVVDKAKEVLNSLGSVATPPTLPSLGGGGLTSIVAAAAGGGALAAAAGMLGGSNPLASLRSPSVSRALSALGGGAGGALSRGGGAIRPQRAIIKNLDGTQPSVIECQYNPKEYTISKQNKWGAAKVQSEDDIPDIVFNGGDPMILKVQLFFDTTEDQSDVSAKTRQLFDLMMVSEALTNRTTKKGRPPMVCLIWSKTPNFEAVITSASQKFTLFRADGTPLRATVDVTFQQITKPGKYPPQNPTSGGDGGEQLWSVKTGDTLAWISYKVYGDSTRWRLIAEANRLLNVRRLTPGMTLVIPNA